MLRVEPVSIQVALLGIAARLFRGEDVVVALGEIRLVGKAADLLKGPVQGLAHAVEVRAILQLHVRQAPSERRVVQQSPRRPPLIGLGGQAPRRAQASVGSNWLEALWLSEGQGPDDVPVAPDEEHCQRVGDHLNGRLEDVGLPLASHRSVGDGFRDPVQRATLPLDRSNNDLQREHAGDRQPVEHVVNGGASEGTLELDAVAALAQGHDGAGDGRPDVRAQDYRDAGLHGDPVRTHQTHHDGHAGGGGLHHDGGEDASH
mmetsp:Transcript_139630/g.389469  ORF Transcript_139630/g.389469 Transcript_139630/m.389469 type:complete len:260 (+) Transcript_139630:1121-1900(+)